MWFEIAIVLLLIWIALILREIATRATTISYVADSSVQEIKRAASAIERLATIAENSEYDKAISK